MTSVYLSTHLFTVKFVASGSLATLPTFRLTYYRRPRWSCTARLVGGTVGHLSGGLHCAWVVPGHRENIDDRRLSVADRPLIRCPVTSAAEGDRNVALRCEVSARPPLTALFWIIDVNGTTVTEGQVVNEYWTLVMVSDRT